MKQRNLKDINEFILHCSANGPNSQIGAYEIRKYHMLPESQGGRGWEDIGYHFVIKRDGTVEPGRKLEYQGAHCTGHNRLSIGICLVGGVDKSGRPEDNFTFLQFEALAMMLRELRKRWPQASIHGHCDYANKACPVFDVRQFCQRYDIAQTPGETDWDAKRWPHFKPAEFTALWNGGEMPEVWVKTLDALERLRAAYGKPLIIKRSEYKADANALSCDIKVPAQDHKGFINLAIKAGFSSAMSVDGAVRVYGIAEGGK